MCYLMPLIQSIKSVRIIRQEALVSRFHQMNQVKQSVYKYIQGKKRKDLGQIPLKSLAITRFMRRIFIQSQIGSIHILGPQIINFKQSSNRYFTNSIERFLLLTRQESWNLILAIFYLLVSKPSIWQQYLY
ncbi:hypothetical protein FGO68_gene12955 [Halteria grandinella]|uniref:Uncharacterized protein n=1 Tax=Halteria grandinella TaxID=5974 RepID=A0A8J8P2H9_HALGN|nr:hypothetical protein FGO68_gene12955 [Halteria grandinella]